MKVLGINLDYFSTNPDDGWIHVRCNGDANIENLIKCNMFEPTIFITPSGFSNGKIHPKFFGVPYSSHSNYFELQAFIKAVMPFKLSFIVPYINKGVVTQKGPGIFLRSYVRKKLTPIKQIIEEKKIPYEVKISKEKMVEEKLGKKRRSRESSSIISMHKTKRLRKSLADITTISHLNK